MYLFPAQFAMVEVMVTSLLDGYERQLMKVFKHKELLVLAVWILIVLL